MKCVWRLLHGHGIISHTSHSLKPQCRSQSDLLRMPLMSAQSCQDPLITVHPGVSGQTNQARPDARMGPFRPRLGSPRWTWIRAGVQARQDEPDVWPCPDEARRRMPGCSEGSKPDAQMSRQPGRSPSGFVSGLPGCFLLAQTSGHLGHLGIWPDLKYMSVLQI